MTARQPTPLPNGAVKPPPPPAPPSKKFKSGYVVETRYPPHSAETCLQLNAVQLYQLAQDWEEQAVAREAVWLQDPIAAALKHCSRELHALATQQERRSGPQ